MYKITLVFKSGRGNCTKVVRGTKLDFAREVEYLSAHGCSDFEIISVEAVS